VQATHIDDFLRLPRGFAPGTQVLLDDVAQVVDRIQIDVLEFRDVCGDVPWHGDVDQEHRPVSPAGEGGGDHVAMDQGFGARGRGDDDVRLGQVSRDLVERDGVGVELGGERVGAFHGPVGDHHASGALLVQVSRRQLDGFPGADQQGRLFRQIAEDLACQAHSGECDGNRAGPDGGIRAHLLGDGKRMLKQAVEQGADGAGLARDAEGLFHLPQYLGFAEHHGIEPRGHAEDVAHGGLVMVGIEELAEHLARQGMVPGQPFGDRCLSRLGQMTIELRPVAGGEDDGLGGGRGLDQAGKRRTELRFGEVHALPDLDRCSAVIDAEREQGHERDVRTGGLRSGSEILRDVGVQYKRARRQGGTAHGKLS